MIQNYVFSPVGDAEGKKVQVSYQMKSEKRTNSGGPYIFRSFALYFELKYHGSITITQTSDHKNIYFEHTAY